VQPLLKTSKPAWDLLANSSEFLAEGARFELAVHEVDAGFQDRWFQPLTHPSEIEFISEQGRS
jgi:hypothetical protein